VHLADPTDEELDAVYERLWPLIKAWAEAHPPQPFKLLDKISIPRFKRDVQMPDLRSVLLVQPMIEVCPSCNGHRFKDHGVENLQDLCDYCDGRGTIQPADEDDDADADDG
jgi:hypothetical protein